MKEKKKLELKDNEGRLFTKVLNHIRQAEKKYAGVAIDYTTNEIWDINDELRKESLSKRQLTLLHIQLNVTWGEKVE